MSKPKTKEQLKKEERNGKVITGISVGIVAAVFLWIAFDFMKREAETRAIYKDLNQYLNKPEPKVKMPTKEELRRGGYEIEEENRILDEWEELRRGLDE